MSAEPVLWNEFLWKVGLLFLLRQDYSTSANKDDKAMVPLFLSAFQSVFVIRLNNLDNYIWESKILHRVKLKLQLAILIQSLQVAENLQSIVANAHS